MSWAKLTNSLSYTTLNICYSKNNIYNIPRGKAFLFRRMMMKHSNLIARDHTSSIGKKQFCEVKKKQDLETGKNKLTKARWVILDLLQPMTLHCLTYTTSSRTICQYRTLIKISKKFSHLNPSKLYT